MAPSSKIRYVAEKGEKKSQNTKEARPIKKKSEELSTLLTRIFLALSLPAIPNSSLCSSLRSSTPTLFIGSAAPKQP